MISLLWKVSVDIYLLWKILWLLFESLLNDTVFYLNHFLKPKISEYKKELSKTSKGESLNNT